MRPCYSFDCESGYVGEDVCTVCNGTGEVEDGCYCHAYCSCECICGAWDDVGCNCWEV